MIVIKQREADKTQQRQVMHTQLLITHWQMLSFSPGNSHIWYVSMMVCGMEYPFGQFRSGE